jgi:hypothetical protein
MIHFYLPHKKPNEKIILLIRPHKFIICIKLLFWALLALLPPIPYLLFKDFDTAINNPFFSTFIMVFLGIYYLFIWLFILSNFVDYFLDIWIVTSERIINIEQKQLFSRTTSEQELSKIQDITAEVIGMIPTFLNYGNVYVQTAAEKERFIFRQVPTPLEIKRKITSLCEYIKKNEISNNGQKSAP